MLGGGAELLTRRPRAARHAQRARVDGLGRVGGLGRKTRRLGDQSVGPAGVAWEERGLVAMLQGV